MKRMSAMDRKQAAYRKANRAADIPRAPIPKGPQPKAYSPLHAVYELLVRDGPYCHICSFCCDFMETRRPLPLTATRDHIIPASQGGTLARENLRLAHACCNNKRGDLPITDELRHRCRAWVLEHVGLHPTLDVESWFNANVRPILPLKPRTVIGEFSIAYQAEVAKREDLFFRCVQGGLANGR